MRDMFKVSLTCRRESVTMFDYEVKAAAITQAGELPALTILRRYLKSLAIT